VQISNKLCNQLSKPFSFSSVSDPCEKKQKLCEHYSQCVSYNDGRTECVCDDQCPKVEEPVCGTDGRDYTNECVLKATACRENRDVAVSDTGLCGGKAFKNTEK